MSDRNRLVVAVIAASVVGLVALASDPAAAVQRKSNSWPGGYAFRGDGDQRQSLTYGVIDNGATALALPSAVVGAIPSPFYYAGNGLPDGWYIHQSQDYVYDRAVLRSRY